MYDCPSIVKGRAACFSYNDGNFATSSQSPFFPAGVSKKRIDATLRYEREVKARLDLVFTMSEYLRRSFINNYGISAEKVVSIGAGINLDRLPEIDTEKDYSVGNVLFIGVDFERKGGNEVLKAFQVMRETIPRATLHVVGPKNIPSGLVGIPGVIWHGFLRKTDELELTKLRELFRNAVLFVMPSRYEPFGIAPLEAMSYGIPCIVSNAWALPEIVPDKKCGRLVEPGNWEELAATLTELLANPVLLSRYGAAARMHVEGKYTWPKVVDKLEQNISQKIHA
jgi:glycosyltransferase involved in cell wall biosynthesis